MGLRYFDRVVVVSAGRFTEMEAVLRGELERHTVPYCMVRTKDNFVEKKETLKQIRDDLEKTHKVETNSAERELPRDAALVALHSGAAVAGWRRSLVAPASRHWDQILAPKKLVAQWQFSATKWQNF
eukprot:Skav211252  [mRNA]  locus=scaffold3676:71756:75497:+ [translate_table: standard]